MVLTHPRPAPRWAPILFGLALAVSLSAPLAAAPAPPGAPPAPAAAAPDKEKKSDDKAKPDDKGKPGEKSFDEVVKDAQKFDGYFTLYQVKKELFAEIRPDQLDTPFLLQISRASGLADRGVVFGDPVKDALLCFHQVGDQLQLVERNTLFRAPDGSALQRSIRRSFSDSVLAAFKVEATHPERKSLLVNLNSYFLTDVAATGDALNPPGQPGGYSFDPAKSYWGRIQAFPQNLELESVGTFTTGRPRGLDTVPDPRGFQVTTHYSLVKLGESDYRPRLFDARVGYFVEAWRDYANPEAETPFGRYILRWNLQKRDPSAALSPPKKPIVFWLENNIPVEHRAAVRDGILLWNRAFERVGIKDAIEVREQPDNADWDSNDFRYNTVRWVTSPNAVYAVAQFRSHPLTGEILKANITIDGNWVRYDFNEYEDLVNPLGYVPMPDPGRYDPARFCDIGRQAAAQLAFGATALELRDGALTPEQKKQYLYQALREVTCHEMGHVLGLRHNFHASTMLPLSELNNTAITHERGQVGSVMDYNPANIAPPGTPQGDFFTGVVGPYDLWAIEYGYTTTGACTPDDELPALRRIASRAAAPELAYGTDEECDFGPEPRSINPLITRYDLSSDPLGWAEQRMRLCRDLLRRIETRVPAQGKSYTELRRKFSRLMGTYMGMAFYVSKEVGGIYTSRSFRGDPGAGLPQQPVPAAQQRRALGILESYLFDTRSFQFPPSLLNKLARENNWHWGVDVSQMLNSSDDYPLREQVLATQRAVLARLTHPVLLSRLANGELRVANPNEALTLPELLSRLTNGIWSEVASPTTLKPISGMRRSLQREHLNVLIGLMLQPLPGTPEDARTLAWSELTTLRTRLVAAQKVTTGADAYTRAHLAESAARITKALDARMTVTAR
jgi:hypothetical protein